MGQDAGTESLLHSMQTACPYIHCKPGWGKKCCGNESSELKVSAEIVAPSMSLQPHKIHTEIKISALSC